MYVTIKTKHVVDFKHNKTKILVPGLVTFMP